MSYIAGSAIQLIGKQTLGGTTATVTFSSIPQNFSHLQVFIIARGSAAVVSVSCLCRFNSDTGANYDLQNIYGNNSVTVGASASVAATAHNLGGISGASNAANYSSPVQLVIFSYAATTFYKSMLTTIGINSSTAINQLVETTSSTWRNTAAITSMTFSTGSGSFLTGSSFYLYGML